MAPRSSRASGSDGTYYLHYGYPSASNPPDDWANVFMVGDDFNDGTLTSGLTTSTNGTASISETGGEAFIDLGTDENNDARVYAFALLQSFLRNRPVFVVLEVYQSSILAASRRIFLRNMALLVLSVLMALFFIWWAGNTFILRRISAMVEASRKLAAGDMSARIGKIGAHDELNHLAGVFDEMAASLQKRIEKETQVTASLKRSREQLRSLAAYQNEVREQERIRIAREIHDQLGQSLTLLRMDLSWLKKQLDDKNPTVDEKMEAMFQVLADALENLHTVTTELRPIILDDFGLAAAIEWQVEEFRNRVGIECRMAPTDFEPDLPKDQATALFRIFQETLTNIMRHAQASEVVVHLEARDGDSHLDRRRPQRGPARVADVPGAG